ncbi:MAG TPA: electron transport complex subunit RsxA [Candidatus Desulfofervidus auxilii]|uniref:Ion-translocating oxidoreductase complex subunit A n=1 Tax=Desulfofervidus auxilii TaxID=1621989 RepID=A0A7V0NEG6_DESA2|nr:electron transport complex subunit RsxA [Candidatus Desulfofervidus auxilii]
MHEAWTFSDYLLLIVGAILVNNILLVRFLGNCPFLGVSKKMDTALGMAVAVIFVISCTGPITWFVQHHLLEKFDIVYLRTLAFILTIAVFVQLVEMVIKKVNPTLYRGMGIYLPLITTNCAVLGTCFLNIDLKYNLLQTLIFSFASATGWSLALIIMAGIRERFSFARIPKNFQDTSIGLITAGLIGLSFYAFQGLAR